MTPSLRLLRDLAAVAVLAGLLGLVYLLPPDTSLAELRRRGAITACVPAVYPPLVTGDADAPGIDIELLRAAAARMDLGLTLTIVPEMGRDFNPRSWRLTRAKCQVIAGGVVDSQTTRSFLDVSIPHAETGWATLRRDPGDPNALAAGLRVGVLPAPAGIDRLALSRLLRDSGAVATLVRTPEDLADGLATSRFDLAFADALVAEPLAAAHGWTLADPPGLPRRYPVVFGLWKGDLTLKRALDGALAALEADGSTAAIRARYLGGAATS